MTFNEDFFDASLRHQIDLLRFGSGVARRVNRLLDETRADLRKQVERRLGKTTGITGASLRRLRELQRAVERIRSPAWNDVTEEWTRTAVDVALDEPIFVAGTLTSTLPVELDFVQPSERTLRGLVTTRPFQGRHLREWAQSAQRADLARIHQQIRIGMVQGESSRDIAARVFGERGAMSITRSQAEAVTRTVINGVSNAAQQEFLQANSDLFDVEVFVSTLDSRTSPQCFPGRTTVVPTGEVRRLFRRWYEGEVLVVTTASGKQLVGTPKHPVLTASGWLGLDELQPGKHVLYSVPDNSFSVHGQQSVDVPTTFAELADAILQPTVANIERACASATDFHGDGMGANGEVNVASIKRGLRLSLDSSSGQVPVEGQFASGHMRGILSTERPILSLVQGRSPAVEPTQVDTGALEGLIKPASGSRPTEQSRNIDGSDAIVEQANGEIFVGLDGRVADSAWEMWHDSVLLQKARDGRGRGFQLPTDFGSGHAIAIAAEDVVRVRRELMVGHVYNLETSTGVYIAGGFIVHNCRAQDGKQYPVGKGPIPPLHVNCRSIRCAVISGAVIGQRPFKAGTEQQMLREYAAANGLGRLGSRDNLPRGHKQAFDAFSRRRMRELTGQVPARTTYQEWLKRQPAEIQDDILGSTRGKLFREGGLTLDRFVNREGDELTLDELRRRNRAAWERAGLGAPPVPRPQPPEPAPAPPAPAPAPRRRTAADFTDRIDVDPGVPASMREAIESAVAQVAPHRLPRLTIAETLETTSYGDYEAFSGELRVKTRRTPVGSALPDQPRPGLLWSISNTGKTPEEAARLTALHELGHHAHMHGVPRWSRPEPAERTASVAQGAVAPRVDEIVGDLFEGRRGGPREYITDYAGESPRTPPQFRPTEYFAEAHAAYHAYPDWLRRVAPRAYAAVEEVIRIRREAGL